MGGLCAVKCRQRLTKGKLFLFKFIEKAKIAMKIEMILVTNKHTK